MPTSSVMRDRGCLSIRERPATDERLKKRRKLVSVPALSRAILLTHGHLDHAGSCPELAEAWNVNVYAHRLELPYLTGKSTHPPLDVTGPALSHFLKHIVQAVRDSS